MPPNQIEVKLKFPRRRSAKVMGTLASEREHEPIQGEPVRGILVTHNFHSKIVAPEDLSTYTPLRVGCIHSKLHVPFVGSIITLRLFLQEVFAGIQEQEIMETIPTNHEDEDDERIEPMIPRVFLLHDGQVSINSFSFCG
jgi:Pre-mRNA 3'-end-processing endonuclease polyadenylation factor C-term